MTSHVSTQQTIIIYRPRVDVGNGIACLWHRYIVLNRWVMMRDIVHDRSMHAGEIPVSASQRGNFRSPAATARPNLHSLTR
jgi:hypothetical protein